MEIEIGNRMKGEVPRPLAGYETEFHFLFRITSTTHQGICKPISVPCHLSKTSNCLYTSKTIDLRAQVPKSFKTKYRTSGDFMFCTSFQKPRIHRTYYKALKQNT